MSVARFDAEPVGPNRVHTAFCLMARNQDKDPVPVPERVQQPAPGQKPKCSYCPRVADVGKFQATTSRDDGGQDIHQRAVCSYCMIRTLDRCLRPREDADADHGVSP